MKRTTVKKISAMFFSLLMLTNAIGCQETKPNPTTSSEVITETPAPTEETTTQEPKATKTPEKNTDTSTKTNNIEAGIGKLKFYYNKEWTYNEEQSVEGSLAFTRDETLLGVICSNEKTFQVPQDMMKRSLSMVEQTAEDFELIEEMTGIDVNGTTWYQCLYKTGKGNNEQYSLQRTYGKYYRAYTMTYTGLKKDFMKYKTNAVSIFNTAVFTKDEELGPGAEIAKKELIGELDAGDYGYLELNEDGTYYWYSDSDKNMENYHYGTYSCDNQIKSLNISATQNGIYLVLFPEKYFVNGEETDMGAYKVDLAISKTTQNGADYQGVNLNTYTVYDFTRIK